MSLFTSPSPNLLFVVLVLFLLMNLLVGIYGGRHVRSFSNYALADRKLGTIPLMITIIVTTFGARYVNLNDFSFKDIGLSTYLIPPIGLGLVLFFAIRYIFPKFAEEKDCYTLGDILGKFYGKRAQIFVGVLSVVSAVILLTAQWVQIGLVADTLHFGKMQLIIWVGLITMLYTWMGGMRAVVFTDILQFSFFMGGALFITYNVLLLGPTQNPLGRLTQFASVVKNKYQEGHAFYAIFDRKNIEIFTASLHLALIIFSAPIINRVLMAKNRSQMKKSFYGWLLFYPFLKIFLLIIGLGIAFAHGGEKIFANKPFVELFNHFSKWEVGFGLLLFMIALAIIMATADSFLNAIVVVGIRDIIAPLRGKKHKEDEELSFVTYVTLLAGSIPMMLALWILHDPSVESSAYLVLLGLRLLGIFVAPIILYTLGLKRDGRIFWTSIGSFTLLGSIWLYLGSTSITETGRVVANTKGHWFQNPTSVLPLTIFLVTLLSIGLHFFLHKGWHLEEEKEKMSPPKGILLRFLSDPLHFCRNKMMHYGSAPLFISFFLAFSWVLPFLGAPQIEREQMTPFLWIKAIGFLLCGGLLLKKRWPKRLKYYFPLYYYVSLIYCLPFSYTFLFLCNPNNLMHTLFLSISIFLVGFLLDKESFLLFISLSIALAIMVWFFSTPWLSMDTPTRGYFMVAIGFSLFTSFFLSNLKERFRKMELIHAQMWGRNYVHQLDTLLQGLLNHARLTSQLLKEKGTFEKGKGYTLTLTPQAYKESLLGGFEWLERHGNTTIQQSNFLKGVLRPNYMDAQNFRRTKMLGTLKNVLNILPESFGHYVKIEDKEDFEAFFHPLLLESSLAMWIKHSSMHRGASVISIGCDSLNGELYIKDNGREIHPEA